MLSAVPGFFGREDMGYEQDPIPTFIRRFGGLEGEVRGVRLSSAQTPDLHIVLQLEHLYRPLQSSNIFHSPPSQNSPSSPEDTIVGGDVLDWDQEGHAGRWGRHLPLRYKINSSTSLWFWGVKGTNGVFWELDDELS